MGKINKKAVGARIKAIREDIGMTMVEFGEWLETTQSSVSNWERGENLPNKYRIKRIATIGKISVQDLLHGVKRYMYGIEWWNGKWIREPKNKTLPVVFASEEAANDWLISKGYYKEGSAKKILGFLTTSERFRYLTSTSGQMKNMREFSRWR